MANWNNYIEKYRKGELSASEMHALEKRALSDPFLADALEGVENVSSQDFSYDVSELNEKILERKKESLWTPLRIAAGIILIAGVSSVMYFVSNSSDSEKNLALQKETKSSPAADSDARQDSVKSKNENLITLNKPEPVATEKSDRVAAPKPQIITQPKEAPADKETEFKAGTLAQGEAEAEENKQETKKVADEIALAPVIAEPEKSLELKAQPAQRATEDLASSDKRKVKKELSYSVASGAAVLDAKQLINGKVTSSENGSPMPGVNVVVKGTSIGTITDEQGNYSLELPNQKNAQLVFSFIGSLTDEVPVNDQSTVNAKLKDDVSQLSEVVVVGYGADNGSMAADDDFPTLLLAEPTGGKRNFKKYLETNLQYPQQALENKIEGRVTIQFTIRTDGSIDEFKIVKGIGHGCDEEVIRLVKQGPKWYPSRKGEAAVDSRMRVRMRFKLPE